MSTQSKLEEAIREYYEMLGQLSPEELEQLTQAAVFQVKESMEQEMLSPPPFFCRKKSYSD